MLKILYPFLVVQKYSKSAKVDGFISATNESADLRKATYEESEGWYAGITADMFG
jgi:hypothetical protein